MIKEMKQKKIASEEESKKEKIKIEEIKKLEQ